MTGCMPIGSAFFLSFNSEKAFSCGYVFVATLPLVGYLLCKIARLFFSLLTRKRPSPADMYPLLRFHLSGIYCVKLVGALFRSNHFSLIRVSGNTENGRACIGIVNFVTCTNLKSKHFPFHKSTYDTPLLIYRSL